MNIQELKKKKRAIVATMRKSRALDRQVLAMRRDFAKSIRKFSKKDRDFYSEPIARMCVEVNTKMRELGWKL